MTSTEKLKIILPFLIIVLILSGLFIKTTEDNIKLKTELKNQKKYSPEYRQKTIDALSKEITALKEELVISYSSVSINQNMIKSFNNTYLNFKMKDSEREKELKKYVTQKCFSNIIKNVHAGELKEEEKNNISIRTDEILTRKIDENNMSAVGLVSISNISSLIKYRLIKEDGKFKIDHFEIYENISLGDIF